MLKHQQVNGQNGYKIGKFATILHIDKKIFVDSIGAKLLRFALIFMGLNAIIELFAK